MNKDDIKKGLEYCTNWEYCPDCPYFNCGNRNCSDTMKLDALNLITEQEKEIELLKMQMKDVVNHADTFLAEEQKFEAENVKLKSEIERLKAENEQLKSENKQLNTNAEILARGVRDLNHENYELTEKIKQAKIDVLKRVKRECAGVYPEYIPEIIDDLIEEIENNVQSKED